MAYIKECCVVAGSFDPVTKGHMHIIGTAAMMFESVIVAIGVNDQKKYTFTLDERLSMLKKACAKYSSVKVTSYEGLTADFMQSVGARYFVRGVRNDDDTKYEEKVYKEISSKNHEVESVLLSCPKELKKISSTYVKELIAENKPYENYLPYEIIEDIEEYSRRKK